MPFENFHKPMEDEVLYGMGKLVKQIDVSWPTKIGWHVVAKFYNTHRVYALIMDLGVCYSQNDFSNPNHRWNYGSWYYDCGHGGYP